MAAQDTKQSKTIPREISGAMVGTITWEPDPNVPEGAMPVRSIFDAAGPMTHLGASTIHLEHTPWPDAAGTVTDGEFMIVAANGDKIWGIYEGTTDTSDPEHLIGHATFVITGGTGRFAYVSGTFEATALVTVLGPPDIGIFWPVTWVLEGTVSYLGNRLTLFTFLFLVGK